MFGTSISKIMNALLNSKEFMEDIYARSTSVRHFNDLLGDVLKYYISTRDTKVRTYQEIKDLLYKIEEKGTIKNIKKNETIAEALERNIITEGFVTHSTNGYNKKKIKKYGLGDKRIYDSQLSKDLAFLEEKVEKSKYLTNQTNYHSEIYYTSPGANSFHYATSLAPERLFLGPLKQDKNTALPIIIGETKEEYMMRVAKKKLSDLPTKKEQKETLKVYERVIHKLCSKSPVIELIPIQNKKIELNASNAWTISENPPLLREWIQKMANKDMRFFADYQGGSDPSNMGNLVSIGVKVPPSCLEVIDVPDGFEILQNIAIARGLKQGDAIDFFTGEQVTLKESRKNEGNVEEIAAVPVKINDSKFDYSIKKSSNEKKQINKR